ASSQHSDRWRWTIGGRVPDAISGRGVLKLCDEGRIAETKHSEGMNMKEDISVFTMTSWLRAVYLLSCLAKQPRPILNLQYAPRRDPNSHPLDVSSVRSFCDLRTDNLKTSAFKALAG